MDKFKIFLNRTIMKLRNALLRLYNRSYGMDDLNKALIIASLIFSVLEIITRNMIPYYLSLLFFFAFLFRFLSTKKFKRSEENRKYRHYFKYWQLKWVNRKTHRVYRCKQCGQFIRVPKGKGKIETTCPKCGNKEIHNS